MGRDLEALLRETARPPRGHPDVPDLWRRGRRRRAVRRVVASGAAVAVVAVGAVAVSATRTDAPSPVVADGENGQVHGADVERVVAEIVVPYAGDVTFAAGSVWVAHPEELALSRIDPETNRVSSTIAIPGRGRAQLCGMTTGDDGTLVLNVCDDDPERNRVVLIDAEAGEVSATVGFDRMVMAATVAQGSLWAVTGGGSTREILRLDPATGSRLGAIELDRTVAHDIVPGFGSVWLSTVRQPELSSLETVGEVLRIDPRANDVSAAIRVGDPGRFFGESDPALRTATSKVRGPADLAVTARAVWVAIADEGRIARIDPGSDRVTGEVGVAGSSQRWPWLAAAGEDDVWVRAGPSSLILLSGPTASVRERIRLEPGVGGPAIAAGAGSVWAPVDRRLVVRLQ